jgi:hypothetical protein
MVCGEIMNRQITIKSQIGGALKDAIFTYDSIR